MIALRLDGHEFSLRADSDRLVATAGAGVPAAATVETDPATLAALLWHGLDVAQAVADGRLAIVGDQGAARSLLDRYRPRRRALSCE